MDDDHIFDQFNDEDEEEEFDPNNHELVELFDRTSVEDHIEFTDQEEYE